MAFEMSFSPGFNGWLAAPCSQCARKHPGACSTADDPEFKTKLAAHLGAVAQTVSGMRIGGFPWWCYDECGEDTCLLQGCQKRRAA